MNRIYNEYRFQITKLYNSIVQLYNKIAVYHENRLEVALKTQASHCFECFSRLLNASTFSTIYVVLCSMSARKKITFIFFLSAIIYLLYNTRCAIWTYTSPMALPELDNPIVHIKTRKKYNLVTYIKVES